MAKAKKATTKSKKPASKSTRSSRVSKSGGLKPSIDVGRFLLPLGLMACAMVVILFIAFSGYQTATASTFFALKQVDVRGIERASAEDIRRTVASQVEKTGVWNADLSEIKNRVEKFQFVKSAAVSRVLPTGIRVNIQERVPVGIVHLSSGDFLIDGEAFLLAPVSQPEKTFPVVLKGWDESKTEKAATDNLTRIKMYRKMLDDWKQFDLESRVKEINLADLKEPKAVVEDSGRQIYVSLARDNFGRSLKTAIEVVAGKGSKIKSVDAAGVSPVIQYLDY